MAKRPKAYKATSLSGAQDRVRRLERHVAHLTRLFEEAHKDRVTFAMLAADGPCFHNPLVVYEAKKRRDYILATWCHVKPDGRTLAS